MGNKESTHASSFSRGQGATSDIRDALAGVPGVHPKNKTGRKVTAQKIKTASATGVLALQEHGLKEVPAEVFQLVNLRSLNLATNALTLLPAPISSLTKLKTLRLDSNKLEALPDLGPLSALTDLSASANALNGVGALVSLPPSLTKVVLKDNNLGGMPLAIMEGLPALQVLDLSGNAVDFVPKLAAAVPALSELNLDHNALRTLGDELVGLPRLKRLFARANRIAAVDPATGGQAISQRLFADSSVETLELAGNILDKSELVQMEGVEAFLSRREKIKNKNLQGGALLTLSVCGLD